MNICPSLNSEEAKSTTWLHPVSGEAVITGHRKTPGKVSPNGCQVSPLSLSSHMSAVMCCRYTYHQTDTSRTDAVASALCLLRASGLLALVSPLMPSRAHLCPARAHFSFCHGLLLRVIWSVRGVDECTAGCLWTCEMNSGRILFYSECCPLTM